MSGFLSVIDFGLCKYDNYFITLSRESLPSAEFVER